MDIFDQILEERGKEDIFDTAVRERRTAERASSPLIPFNFDAEFDKDPRITAQNRSDIADIMWPYIRPFIATGYKASEAFNRGMAHFAEGMDLVGYYSVKALGMDPSKVDRMYKAGAEGYEANADWWRRRADEVGVTVIDEFMGEALGGAVPGIGEFMLNVPWAAMTGAARAAEAGENPLAGALTEGIKRGVLGYMFKVMEPFRTYLRMPMMGGVFGVQAWGEGAEMKDVAKSVGTGALYALSSPGGRMGLNDLRRVEWERPGRPEEMRLPRAEVETFEHLRPMKNRINKEPRTDWEGRTEGMGLWAEDIADLIRKGKIKEPELFHGYDKEPYRGIEKEFGTHFTDDIGVAKEFGDKVLRAKLRTKNPLLVDDVLDHTSALEVAEMLADKGIIPKKHPLMREWELNKTENRNWLRKLRKEVKDAGYDSIIYNNFYEGGVAFIALDKRQIRPLEPVKGAERMEGHVETVRRIAEAKEAGYTLAVRDFKTGEVIEALEGERLHPDIATRMQAEGRDVEHLQTGWTNRAGEFTTDIMRRPVEMKKPRTRPSESKQDVTQRREDEQGRRRQRQFLKTVDESMSTEEQTRQKIREIDPQEYKVHADPETEKLVTRRINEGFEEAKAFAMDEKTPATDEKGFTGIRVAEILQSRGMYNEAAEVIESLDRQFREAGRFIRAASKWNALTPTGFLKWSERMIDQVNRRYSWLDTILGRKRAVLTEDDRAFIATKIAEVSRMPDGIDKTDATLQVIDYVAAKVPPGVKEMVDAYRYQNMLSGWRTHQRNIGENIVNTFVTRPFHIGTRGAIDWFMSRTFGKERQYYVRDAKTYVKTAINAVPNAVNAFIESYKLQKIEGPLKPDLGLGVEGKSEMERQFGLARARQIPGALTVIQRFMEACDRFNSTLIAAGEEAIMLERGVAPEVAARSAQKLAQEYLYRGKLDAKDPRFSYMSQALSGLGKIMEQARHLPVIGRASGWVVPFLRTPLNKGIAMVEMSPLGALRPIKSWDMEIAAKVLGGSMITAVGALFAMTGNTTWTAPSGQREKQWFYASGRKQFSLRIGDKWIPFWYLGPFAMAFGIPAAIKHYWEDEKVALAKGAPEKVFSIVAGLARFLGSQTSAQSIGNLFAYLSGDIDISAVKQFAFTIGQVVPAQAMVRQIAYIADPIYRKPFGFWEMIKKDVPWMREELAARKDPFHMPSERDTINFFIPYDVGVERPEYETLYPSVKRETRMNYLAGKLNDVMDRVGKGEMDSEEGLGLYVEYLEAFTELE